jgi:hypothetical protein
MHYSSPGGKYEPVLLDNAYKVHMKLTIRAVAPSDFGSYKCVSKNSLGDTDGNIKLYREYIPVYLMLQTTAPKQRSPSCEACSRSANQEISRLLWNPKLHYCFHKKPPLVLIPNHMNPIHVVTSNLYNYFNIIFLSTPRSCEWSLPFRFTD